MSFFIEGFEKKAFLGTLVGKPLMALGKSFVKSPVKTGLGALSVGFTGYQIGSSMSAGSDAVGSSRTVSMPSAPTGPTF